MHKITLMIATAILACAPSFAFSAEGDLDTTFGQSGVVTFNKGGGSFAEAMALQPDGRKIVVGTVSGVMNSDILVMRLNPDGTRDISFGLDGVVIFDGPSNSGDAATGVALRPDGRIVVAGLTSNGADDDILVFQLNRNGARDISFGTAGVAQFDRGGNEAANDVVLMPDGRVVLAGTASNATDNDIIIMRLTSAGLPDISFGGTGSVLFDRGGNDSGRAVALLPDNRIVVAGQSSNGLNGDLIVLRVNLGGAPDISFGGIGGDVPGSVTFDNGGRDAGNAVAIQADGRVVVAGTSSNGVSDDLLVLRLLQNGVLDISFSLDGIVLFDGAAQGSDVANAIVIQNNGKIVVTGFSSNGSVADVIVARLDFDGTRDTTFGGDGVVTYHASDFGDAEGNAVIIQPDNYILVAGTGANRLNDFVLVLRFNPNGLLDPAFNAGGVFTFRQRVNTSEGGNAVALLPNGRIVVAGQTASGISNDMVVMKFRSDGTRDASFSGDGIAFFDGGGGGNDIARGVAVQSDNKIVVAGQTSNGVNSDVVVLRYGTDGRLDASLNVDGIAQFNGAANNDDVGRAVTAANGKIVVVGQTSNGVDNDLLVLRYNGVDGALDTTFGTGGVVTFGGVGNESGYAVAIQADGMIVVAGVSSNGANTDLLLLRFDTNGNPDATFGAGGVVTYDSGSDDAARAVAVQPDGKIVVAGLSFNGTKNVALIARFSSAGIPDASFSTNGIARFNSDLAGDDGANAVAVQADGRIVVAGFRNSADVLVLRYLGEGVLDSSFSDDGVATFNGAAGGTDIGSALALQPDGKIVVTGETNGDLLVLRFIGQKVRLLTPNGGEVVPAGSTQINFITWAAPPKAVTFTLELSLDGGATWSTIATNLTGTVYPSWTVPTPLGNKRQCLIRVTGFDAGNAVVSSDRSDAGFTIEVVKLTFPDGVPPPAVQSFTTGDPITITWTTVATKRPVDSVKLFYTLNNGTTWISIPGVPPGNPGSFAWTAPPVPATRPKSRVKVVLKDIDGVTLGSDISDYKFTINP